MLTMTLQSVPLPGDLGLL